jgi:hypothetical protein
MDIYQKKIFTGNGDMGIQQQDQDGDKVIEDNG